MPRGRPRKNNLEQNVVLENDSIDEKLNQEVDELNEKINNLEKMSVNSKRLSDLEKDFELAFKQKPLIGFRVIKVTSGMYRVIDKNGNFSTPELSENEANRICRMFNLRNPDIIAKMKQIETGKWYENEV